MIKGHNVDFCKENCLVVLHPELHECTISYQWVWILWFCSGFFSVFLLCCPVVSLALTSYSLRLDYMSQKWIKLDVSRTEIRLDPSIYFWMEGIHEGKLPGSFASWAAWVYYLISVGLNTLVLQWVFQCFFTVLSCCIPSSYIILPPSGLHVAEMDKTGCI